MRRLIHPIKYNLLSIVLFALFVVCILAQSFAGWRLQNEILAARRLMPIDYWHNLSTAAFQGLSSNWQAAFLQLASLIAFSGFLYRRGSAFPRSAQCQKQTKTARRNSPLSPGSTAIRFFCVFVALCLFTRSTCYFRRAGLQRGPHICRPAGDLHRCISAFG